MKKFLTKLKNLIPTKRRLIQLYAALLTNANLKGYVNGQIYQGDTKNACIPGLNCYSCPGAIGSCPIGSLQNSLSASGKRAPYYIFGIILLYGILFGRWICGFLCPFGLVQDLLFKIRTPKLKKNRFTKALSLLKYVILFLFVIIIPLAYMFKDFPLPAFCKYICPAGTLGGALGLLSNAANESLFSMLGPLFTWKFLLMVSTLVATVFIYRVFCRFLCPLGALYSIFNKIAICGIKLEKDKCIDCGKCIGKCKMDISEVGDRECINCGECLSVCPTNAIKWRGSKILLPENEIKPDMNEEEKLRVTKKRKKRVALVKIISAVLMIAILASALVYYNFIDKSGIPDTPDTETPDNSGDTPSDLPSYGNRVGKLCYSMDLDLIMSDGTINIEDLKDKVVVLNFWGTWCTPCVGELPEFSEAASHYKDENVVIIAIHTSLDKDTAEDFINKYYPDTEMIFAFDVPSEKNANADEYYTKLGGVSGAYPMTLVLNKKGVITEKIIGPTDYEGLSSAIEEALGQ